MNDTLPKTAEESYRMIHSACMVEIEDLRNALERCKYRAVVANLKHHDSDASREIYAIAHQALVAKRPE